MSDRIDPSVREYVNHPTVALEYDSCFAFNPLFEYDEEFVREHVVPGSRVLDLGVGTGRHLLQLAQSGCRVTGVDLSPHMLAQAAAKLATTQLSAHLIQADMLHLPFAPHPHFDVVLLMFSTLGLIHGAANRRRLLEEVRIRLKGNGRLLFHVHNDEYRHSPHRPIRKRLRDGLARWREELEPGDHIIRNYRGLLHLRLHSFTRVEIEELLAQAGLRMVHLEGLNDRRDGPCEEDPLERMANGYFIIAERG